jgi:hypothetical protein
MASVSAFDVFGEIICWCRESKSLGATAAAAGELLPEEALRSATDMEGS